MGKEKRGEITNASLSEKGGEKGFWLGCWFHFSLNRGEETGGADEYKTKKNSRKKNNGNSKVTNHNEVKKFVGGPENNNLRVGKKRGWAKKIFDTGVLRVSRNTQRGSHQQNPKQQEPKFIPIPNGN